MHLTHSAPGTLLFEAVADLEVQLTAAARGVSCPEHGRQPAVEVRLDRWTHHFVTVDTCCERLARVLDVLIESR